MNAELSFLNEKKSRDTVNVFQRTRQKLFMPDVVTFFLPEGLDGKHVEVIESESKWDKTVPILKNPKAVHSHLHNKTHYKSVHGVLMDDSKIDLADIENQERIKQIQKSVNAKRRKSVRDAFLNLLSDKYVQDRKGKKRLYNRKKEEVKHESDEDDPRANISDFKKATRDLLKEVNVIRRPSV